MNHLISIDDLSAEQALSILEQAKAFVELNDRPIKKAPTLRGRTVINMFFENSTRTRSSFEIAGKRLSADVINFSASSSSQSKGESVLETVRTLGAMNPDCLVVRHQSSGVPAQLHQQLGVKVINAGDGTNEHPTQALLDAYALRTRWDGFDGKTIAIVGDIARSRVARSGTKLFSKLGAEVRWIAPRSLLPGQSIRAMHAGSTQVQVYHDLQQGLDGVDAVMALRIQHERSGASGPYITDTDDYSRWFGISSQKLARFAPQALVLHPGPVNIGVELSRDLIDAQCSLLHTQVNAGVAVRMAVLYHVIAPSDHQSQDPS